MKRIKGTNTKFWKTLKESKTVELEDRISSLPDNVIGHILSFLPTKYAVGTSALSTLWKDQWTLTPNLDFDDTVLMDTSKWDNWDINIRTSFINFIHHVLDLHRAPHICQFRLKCLTMIDASDHDAWISIVLSRKVQKLDLNIKTLSCKAFSSSTLVELRLGSFFLLSVPTLVDLPSLRTIYLNRIEFMDSESAKRLFSSCPVLEDLTFLYCNCYESFHNMRLSTLNISSPTVKRLTVMNYPSWFTIELNTPCVEHLNYVGQLAEGFIPKRLEFLAKACLHVPRYCATKESLKALALGISNVQSLYLSGDVLENLGESRVEFQRFDNLRTLAIGYNQNEAWNMLPILLENCPNLKNLELNDGLFGEKSIEENFKWVPPNLVPACLLLHVEGIKIHEFKGNAQELEMIKYLLINAKVLKNLTVISAMANVQKERKICSSLSKLTPPTGLRDCQVVVVSRFHV